MSGSEPGQPLVPDAPDIDENGVDRGQIRAMLRLSLEERLRRVEDFVESVLEIRDINGPGTVR